jgi:hypothetical protein
MKSVTITTAQLAKLANNKFTQFDQLCAARGRLIRGGMSLEEVNKKIPLPANPYVKQSFAQ